MGAGYGALTQFLLNQFPNAKALCQDGSEEMANLGCQRMVKWKRRVDYVITDFSKPGWSCAIHASFDAVVSTIAIHNVRVAGMIESIYKELFQLLKPGGCFLNLDLTFVPLAKQLGWLKAAGFGEVKSYWHEGREALFGEEDPGSVVKLELHSLLQSDLGCLELYNFTRIKLSVII